MMTAMIGGADDAIVLAVTTRPDTSALVLAAIIALAGWALLRRAVAVSRPARPAPVGDRLPAAEGKPPPEPPAVVALLTNGFEVPPSAVTATVLDLAARRWLRFADADGELVVFTTGSGRTGDQLRPFEQQVLNHVTARSFDGVTSGGTLAASQDRLSAAWWRRFRTDVVRAARELQLTRRRYTADLVAPPAVCAVLAGLLVWWSWRTGDTTEEIRESIAPRVVWLVVALATLALAWSTYRAADAIAERPTGTGEARAARWLGYRARLLAKIPERASVIAPPEQQLALAHAVVMGVAEHVYQQVPIVDEDDRFAWSDAGRSPHVVRVRYPFRPGYGRHPIIVLVMGVAVLAAAIWLRRFLRRVSDGEALVDFIDNFPDQTDLIERIAGILSNVMWIPILWAAWAIVAGAIDSVWTRERTGLVVRARRPVSVVPLRRLLRPLAERDRFAVFLAVDDGARRSISSWLANERTAAPQGAYARVRATPILGYVRSSEPVGTSTRFPGT